MIRVDKASSEPLYLQIAASIIQSIAQQELSPGDALPSVRSLARDLGINLHTVNKAYAVLRDEGYLVMRGRAAAHVADPQTKSDSGRAEASDQKMNEKLYALALSFRAHGGSKENFIKHVQAQADRAYHIKEY